jgi:hypothetical protein
MLLPTAIHERHRYIIEWEVMRRSHSDVDIDAQDDGMDGCRQ